MEAQTRHYGSSRVHHCLVFKVRPGRGQRQKYPLVAKKHKVQQLHSVSLQRGGDVSAIADSLNFTRMPGRCQEAIGSFCKLLFAPGEGFSVRRHPRLDIIILPDGRTDVKEFGAKISNKDLLRDESA